MAYAMLIFEEIRKANSNSQIRMAVEISPMSHESTTAMYNKIYSYGVYIA
jgi:hypothetical protein